MIDRHDSKPGRRGPGIALAALLFLVLAPATAQASRPHITKAPVVAGTAQVGQTLRAEDAEWDGKPTPTATWAWIRCDGAELNEDSCDSIAGATATSYTATAADRGQRLRVMLTVRNKDGSAWAISAPTATVAAATGGAAVAAPQAPAPSGAVLEDQAAALRRMSPTPLVRIGGRLTRSGARITLLTVRAPKGARITVRCIGRGCPARRWARTTAVTRIARFQRVLPAGTKLVITVTKPGRIGKHTTILIRRGKAPTRRDRCLVPGSRKPVACEKVAT